MKEITKKTNILFITTDQQRYDAVGYWENSQVKTPCLDRLAEKGTIFENAYTPFPSCAPARTSLLTGTYTKTHQVDYRIKKFLKEGEWTFVRSLKEAGYHTAAIGKMHFNPMYADHGFDVMRIAEHAPSQAGCFTDDDYHKELLELGYHDEQEEWQFPKRFVEASEKYQQNLQAVTFPYPEKIHSTSWIGRKSIEFLKDQTDESEPYFLWVSFLRPHHPFNPPEPYDRLYLDSDLNVPDPTTGWQSLPDFLHAQFSERTGEFDLSGLNKELLHKISAYYYGTITHIDDWMEQILQHVDLENTIIIFTSDHGEYLGHRGRLFKKPQLPLDDLARVPLVVSWPGSQSSTVSTPVSLVDLTPTLLEAAGLTPPPFLEGTSLYNLINDSVTNEHGPIYSETRGPCAAIMVRRDHWKYIWHAKEGIGHLYDLESDPSEKCNLAGQGKFQQIEEQLRTLIQNWELKGHHK